MSKRFAPYCERNKQPILEQLSVYFKESQRVLEIGSGTGQHGVYFAEQLPHLMWYTSDMPENHASITAWINESELQNIILPIEFTIGRDTWPGVPVDAVFTANTTHIMQPEEVRQMMALIAANLPDGGMFCQYGPMKINGECTSDSNREFDNTLKASGYGGIRSVEQLIDWGKGMKLIKQIPMPANNFLLVWQIRKS